MTLEQITREYKAGMRFTYDGLNENQFLRITADHRYQVATFGLVNGVVFGFVNLDATDVLRNTYEFLK